MNDLIDALRKVHAIQGADGNWNHDSYMHGLYNGLEMALSIMEERQPNFKNPPKAWFADTPQTYILQKEED